MWQAEVADGSTTVTEPALAGTGFGATKAPARTLP